MMDKIHELMKEGSRCYICKCIQVSILGGVLYYTLRGIRKEWPKYTLFHKTFFISGNLLILGLIGIQFVIIKELHQSRLKKNKIIDENNQDSSLTQEIKAKKIEF